MVDYMKNNMNDKMYGPIKNSLPFKKVPLRMITLNPMVHFYMVIVMIIEFIENLKMNKKL